MRRTFPSSAAPRRSPRTSGVFLLLVGPTNISTFDTGKSGALVSAASETSTDRRHDGRPVHNRARSAPAERETEIDHDDTNSRRRCAGAGDADGGRPPPLYPLGQPHHVGVR